MKQITKGLFSWRYSEDDIKKIYNSIKNEIPGTKLISDGRQKKIVIGGKPCLLFKSNLGKYIGYVDQFSFGKTEYDTIENALNSVGIIIESSDTYKGKYEMNKYVRTLSLFLFGGLTLLTLPLLPIFIVFMSGFFGILYGTRNRGETQTTKMGPRIKYIIALVLVNIGYFLLMGSAGTASDNAAAFWGLLFVNFITISIIVALIFANKMSKKYNMKTVEKGKEYRVYLRNIAILSLLIGIITAPISAITYTIRSDYLITIVSFALSIILFIIVKILDSIKF